MPLSGSCKGCGGNLQGTGSWVAIGTDKYHPSCVKCGSCRRALNSNQTVFPDKELQLLCRECHRSLRLPRCSTCDQPIEGSSLSVGPKKWHQACFSCDKCAARLRNGKFCDVKGQVWCIDCAERSSSTEATGLFHSGNGMHQNKPGMSATGGMGNRHASDSTEIRSVDTTGRPMCNACGEKLTGVYVTANGQKYHRNCMKCALCSTVLDKGYLLAADGVSLLCKACNARQKGLLCDICGEVLADRYHQIQGGRKLHPHCLACAECGCSLSGKPIFDVQGRLVCEADHRKLSFPICDVCGDHVSTKYKSNEWGQNCCMHHQTEAVSCICCQRFVCDRHIQAARLVAIREYCISRKQLEWGPAIQMSLSSPSLLLDGSFPDSKWRSDQHGIKGPVLQAKASDSYNEIICEDCSKSAVVHSSVAEQCWRQVQDAISDVGLSLPESTPPIPVKLVGRAELANKSKITHSPKRRALGFTQTQTVTKTNLRGGASKWEEVKQICILKGMSRDCAMGVLAHELLHAWVHAWQFPALQEHVEEGLAELMQAIFLRSLPESAFRAFKMRKMWTNPDKIYGGGFRNAEMALRMCSNNFQTLLHFVLKRGRLPRSGEKLIH